MKNTHNLLTAVLLLFAGSFPLAAFAQGSLTPPGAPAPIMKSLDQIEARTIVNSANTPGDGNNVYIISQPGSYYLTGNLVAPLHLFGGTAKNGIEITANNVTLDLNGFALQGAAGNAGIFIPNGQTNITVRNGTISGWAVNGVSSGGYASVNQVFERLSVSACEMGIFLYGAGVVRDCNCYNNNSDGIYCGAGGICSGCTAKNNAGNGITMGGGIVTACTVQNNISRGIYLVPGTATGCLVEGNNQSGIYVDAPGSMVVGNTCIENNSSSASSEAGIYINDSNNRVEDNHVTESGLAGIQVSPDYTLNIVIKNAVIGNGANNYIIPSGQIAGPLITTLGTITNANPWANFSFNP